VPPDMRFPKFPKRSLYRLSVKFLFGTLQEKFRSKIKLVGRERDIATSYTIFTALWKTAYTILSRELHFSKSTCIL